MPKIETDSLAFFNLEGVPEGRGSWYGILILYITTLAYGHPFLKRRGILARPILDIENFPNQHGGIAVQDSGEAEEGVEYADAGEILAGTEKRDTLFLRRIIDVDRNGDDSDVAPCGTHQKLKFRFVARGDDMHLAHFLKRIEPEACLRIRKPFGSLHGEPEVGELVGKGVLLGHVVVLEPATADDECVRVPGYGLHESGYVAGVVLPVGVEGDGVSEAPFHSLAEAGHQGRALALVGLVLHHVDRCGRLLHQFYGAVGGSVADHEDIVTVLCHRLNHLHDGARVVVRGNDDADAQLFQCCLVHSAYFSPTWMLILVKMVSPSLTTILRV